MPDGTPMNVHYVHVTRADVYRYWLNESNSLVKKLANDFLDFGTSIPENDYINNKNWIHCMKDVNKLSEMTSHDE